MIKKIDVLMPVYSSNFDFLLASVKSIQAQSVPTRLICILNGMSATANKRYKDFLNDLNVDVILTCPLKGVSHALNYALPYIKSDYVARQDDDDISHPFRIELIMKFMKEHELDVAGCNIRIIDSHSKVKTSRTYPAQDDGCKKSLVYKTCFCHPSVVIKSSIFDDNKYPNSKSEDYAFWMLLASSSKFGNLQLPLFFWRRSPLQASSKYIPYLYIKDSFLLLLQYRGRPFSFLQLALLLLFQISYTILKGRQIVYSI